jgi:hypothetical protein
MGLLILGASVVAVGVLLLIGVLVMTEDLFSESVFFGIPDEPGEVTQRQSMHEERSTVPRPS